MVKKQIFEKFALSVVSLALAFLVVEIALRVHERVTAPVDIQWIENSNADNLISRIQNDPVRIRLFNGCYIDSDIMQRDDNLGWLNIPGVQGYSVRVYGNQNLVVSESYDFSHIHAKGYQTEIVPFRINNLGNRGPDMTVKKPAGSRRVVFVGDSITFGYYVEEGDTFPVRVGKALASSFSGGAELEAVNAGVSSLNASQVLAHIRRRVLSWSPDMVIWSFYVNDIRDTGGQETDILFPVRRSDWFRFRRFSALARTVERAIGRSSIGSQLNIDLENPVNKAVKRNWTAIDACLSDAARIFQDHDIPLIVAIFPSAIQFGRPWTSPHYQDRLAALCKKWHIPCVDLLPALEAAGPVDRVYYDGDLIHPNARGHKAAADAIVLFLSSHPGLVCRTKMVDRGQ